MSELDNAGNTGETSQGVNKRASFPKNVRQIGKCEQNRRIYIEDYVVTFVRQLAVAGKEDLIILLGSSGPVEGIQTIFINGAIRIEREDILLKETISKESWDKIYYKIQNYFDGSKILGWGCMSQDSVNDDNYGFMLQKYGNIQRKNFPGNDKLFIHCNLFNQEENLYVSHNNELNHCQGYYVYYERNDLMQEYMMNENESCVKEQVDENDITARIRRTINENEEMKKSKAGKNVKDTVNAFEKAGIIVKGKEKKMASMQKIYTGAMATAVCILLFAAIKSSGVSFGNVINAVNSRISNETNENNEQTADDKDDNQKSDMLEIGEVEGVKPETITTINEVEQSKKPTTEKDDKKTASGDEAKDKDKDEDEDDDKNKDENSGNNVNANDSDDEAEDDKKNDNENDKNDNKGDKDNNKNDKDDTDSKVDKEEDIIDKEALMQMGCKEYEVKQGDTLEGISLKEYGTATRVKDICELNKISDENMIHEGDLIYLPI